MTLQPYRTHRPTAFDGHLELKDEQEGWLIAPCTQTRDSEALDRSNWQHQEAALANVDPNYDNHEAHRFGHWGPGWYEIVVVRPGSECERVALEIDGALSEYPVLDDSHFSELETSEADESFSTSDLWDAFAKQCSGAFTQNFVEGLMNDKALGAALQTLEYEIYEGAYHWNVTRKSIARFLKEARA